MSSSIHELSTLWKVIDRLDKANIAYMLTGFLALNFYGQARATNDIDIVIQIESGDSEIIYKLFAQDFYISMDAVKEALKNQSLFNIIDNENVFKVDFILVKRDPFSQLQFSRRQKIKILDHQIWVISSEDLILSKLAWSQTSLSEIQEQDIKNIIKTMKEKLDLHYLKTQAVNHGFDERLTKIYGSIGYLKRNSGKI